MHNDQTKNQFIQLKALGTPIEDIIQTLGISRTTAFRWQVELKNQIANLRLLHFETIQSRLFGSHEDRLKTAVDRLQRYQKEMDGRQTKYMTMPELQRLILDARKEVEKLTVTPAFLHEPEDAASAPSTASDTPPQPNS
jgi:hypothetical protein